ncbi:hypothetical protein I204_01999 [Kwoniella mangroviensis CBS 8886]|uniref:uncharacterized protein n=1 Tax=Kwoniella mangroviensis CBS 8507 TaxID=1296122 RepID=UPI00080D8115|nr:uncharacterized protein I203_03695 [Kwoniella mangroviensis CBS 8507]OCF67013.1 hypothetical protein I203_03695 [Kwoniella mangroviensis CBS 8507]OCF77993.1 hypothetical protein I204_01999 [Kwoniella mangroviensis CBS 8886]
MSSVESSSSLLIPPNPSLSPTKPSASILLNGNGRESTHVRSPEPPRTTTPLPHTSVFNAYPLSPSSSPSSFPSSPTLSRSTSSPHPSSAALNSRRLSTPKISFAPLPTIPNELKRRNSISIGVASRKHLLGGGNGPNKIVMSDEEWENYKKHYDEKSGNDPIDLGQVAKQGAKALWGKVKSRRSSSVSSQSSITSSTSTTSTSTSNVSSSAPAAAAAAAPALSGSLNGLGTVEEDEEQYETVQTGRGRSLSPRRGNLHTIPGSPPPRQASLDSESSPSTTTSVISDTESDFGDTISEAEEPSYPSYTPGNRVAVGEASESMKHKLLHLEEMGDQKDGDETPRRLPSPPPRKADVEPLPEENQDEDEAENGDGRNTPGGYRARESQWERDHHEKKGRTEILGFDPERFGRALDLAAKNGEIKRD